jgi:hypothetical protein
MSVRIPKSEYLGEEVVKGHIRTSTDALLAQLALHHDYAVRIPPRPIQKRIVVEIQEPEPVEEKVEIFVLPIAAPKLTVNAIQHLVCLHYQVSHTDLISPRRDHKVMRPRQIAMYLARTLTLRSLPEIGRWFGGRDHTTVFHAVRKIGTMVADRHPIADDVNYLREVLSA